MTDYPTDFTIIGTEPDPLWEPPPYTASVIRTITQLAEVGLRPSQVLLPSPPKPGDPLFTTFYGIPVALAPGAEAVQLVLDVPS